MSKLADQLKVVDYARQKLEFKRMSIIEKAAKSDNPDDLIAASNAIKDMSKTPEQPAKAYFIDPLDFNANLGYKDKPFSLTYTTLKRMAKTPIINAIIKTRKNQIADFAEPQVDRYSTGFIIRKKAKFGVEQKMSEREKKTANAITDFLLNCGGQSNWTDDDFDTFIRKIVDDSLTYDQMTFECIRNRRGKLERFVAVDAATFRMADSAFSEDYQNTFFKQQGGGVWANENLRTYTQGKQINGYYPQYVQIYQNAVVNDFYPWELCFGIRNPSTSIYNNGYGCSELEELINIVTSMLWGDEYNRRFFSQGSAPKGLLRVKGNMNESALQQFKQQWQAMISGVMNSWKTPVVEADVDWIDLQKSNRDMEYNAWMEYLIKQSCAIYCIDPTEIGWDISRGSGNSGLFEGSQAERLQNSKDKGLYPMLKFIQRKINKYIIEPLNPDFEFVFIGLDGMTVSEELEMDIKKVSNFQTINEIRAKWSLPELEDTKAGDIIANSMFFQAWNAEQQQANQQNMMGGGDGNNWEEGEGDEGGNPFDDWGSGDDEEEEEDGGNPFDDWDDDTDEEDEEDTNEEDEEDNEDEDDDEEEKAEENTFVKAFNEYLAKEERELNK